MYIYVCICIYILYIYIYIYMLCNACIVIIIFTNVIYFINLFFIVNTPDSIYRDMQCLNKLDLI